MRIRRPSEYIRYTDAELTDDQCQYHREFRSFIKENRGQVLEHADAVWGPTFDSCNK